MPLEQQKELIETLWSIVAAFVDLGFDLDPKQQICGEPAEDDPACPADVVALMEQSRDVAQEDA